MNSDMRCTVFLRASNIRICQEQESPVIFVEFPSQFNEHWALDPIVFKHYALHYKTGDLMPESLVIKIKNASAFNQVYKLTEALEALLICDGIHFLQKIRYRIPTH